MILQGDCLKVMPEFPNEHFDMIFCDLPYGTTKSEWDTVIPLEEMWLQYERIIKPNGAIVLFAKQPFDKMLWASNPKLYRYDWVWEKNKATGHLNAESMPMQAHEYLLVFYKHEPTYNPQMSIGHKPMNYAVTKHTSGVYGKGKANANNAGTTERYPRSILHFDVVNNDDPERIHPNQKPVDLCEYFVRTYTNPGDMVLDNCTGSASIPIACLNLNRRVIGIEKDKDMAEKAQHRVENRQLLMNF